MTGATAESDTEEAAWQLPIDNEVPSRAIAEHLLNIMIFRPRKSNESFVILTFDRSTSRYCC
jgi:hypothetical protein